MARVRHLLICLASGSAFYSGLAPALGLGDISVRSALNQPFEAQIDLLDTSDLSLQDIKIGLASSDAFSRSGVEWTPLAADLRFTPMLQNGRYVVRVRSQMATREPYLSFLVELVRPSGNLRREYTVLLDPSDSAYRTSASVPARASAPAAAPRDLGPLPAASNGHSYQVRSGDSLWLIAQALRASGSEASASSLVRDIQRLNPQAFPGGDSSRLQVGANLRLPDSAAPAGLDEAPSIDTRAVTSANETPAIAPSAPPASAEQAPAVAEAPASEASPSVTAPTDNDSAVAASAPAPARKPEPEAVAAPLSATASEPLPDNGGNDPHEEALRQRLARLEEEQVERDAGFQRLEQTLREIQGQLEQVNGQLGDRDGQIAGLREELSAALAARETAVVESRSENNGLGWPWLLLVGALGLLGGSLLGRRRAAAGQSAKRGKRAAKAEAPEPEQAVAAEAPAPSTTYVPPLAAAAPVAFSAAQPTVTPPAVEEPPVEVEEVSPMPSVAAAAARARRANAVDPLDAAAMYLAYGRSGEARTTLEKALAEEPEREDLRLKLLEVYAMRGDTQELEALEQRGSAAPTQAHGFEALHEPYGDAPTPSPASTEVELSPAEDDFRLNLDDLSLDSEWDQVDPFAAKETPRAAVDATPAQPAELSLVEENFESDLQSLPEVEELDQGALAQVEELSLQDYSPFDRFDRPEDSDALFDSLDEGGEHLGLLNQALAYIEEGEMERACDILNEVISEGDERERQEARELLARIA